MIAGIAQFQMMLWAVNDAAQAILLILLALRRNYRVYPAFCFYILVNLTLGILMFFIYRQWGFSSAVSLRVFWGVLAVIICARALAVAEVCRHLLGRYRGIWSLAWHVLLASAVLVFLFALLSMKNRWIFVLTTAQLGLELAIAIAIVALFVFAKFYDVALKPPLRPLAIGFCLYSCFSVLNNTVLQRFLDQYAAFWNLMGMLAFLASLLLWTWALRKPQSEAESKETLLPAGAYESITPELNLRLRLLNEQLGRFWQAETRRS